METKTSEAEGAKDKPENKFNVGDTEVEWSDELGQPKITETGESVFLEWGEEGEAAGLVFRNGKLLNGDLNAAGKLHVKKGEETLFEAVNEGNGVSQTYADSSGNVSMVARGSNIAQSVGGGESKVKITK